MSTQDDTQAEAVEAFVEITSWVKPTTAAGFPTSSEGVDWKKAKKVPWPKTAPSGDLVFDFS